MSSVVNNLTALMALLPVLLTLFPWSGVAHWPVERVGPKDLNGTRLDFALTLVLAIARTRWVIR